MSVVPIYMGEVKIDLLGIVVPSKEWISLFRNKVSGDILGIQSVNCDSNLITTKFIIQEGYLVEFRSFSVKKEFVSRKFIRKYKVKKLL